MKFQKIVNLLDTTSDDKDFPRFVNCALTDMTVRAAGNNNGLPAIVATTGLEFQITGAKLHIQVVTLSKKKKKTKNFNNN